MTQYWLACAEISVNSICEWLFCDFFFCRFGRELARFLPLLFLPVSFKRRPLCPLLSRFMTDLLLRTEPARQGRWRLTSLTTSTPLGRSYLPLSITISSWTPWNGIHLHIPPIAGIRLRIWPCLQFPTFATFALLQNSFGTSLLRLAVPYFCHFCTTTMHNNYAQLLWNPAPEACSSLFLPLLHNNYGAPANQDQDSEIDTDFYL